MSKVLVVVTFPNKNIRTSNLLKDNSEKWTYTQDNM